jgi:hypothetical protein
MERIVESMYLLVMQRTVMVHYQVPSAVCEVHSAVVTDPSVTFLSEMRSENNWQTAAPRAPYQGLLRSEQTASVTGMLRS